MFLLTSPDDLIISKILFSWRSQADYERCSVTAKDNVGLRGLLKDLDWPFGGLETRL
jgi:hypothetical protein